MPWHIEKRDNKFCVIKDADNSVEGCHASRNEAADQVRALYANDKTNEESLAEVVAQLQEIAKMMVPASLEVAPEATQASEEAAVVETDIEVPIAEHFAWEGVITYEGIQTGDKRLFKEGAVVWNEELLPFPFKWQRVSAEGHDASITIGRVDSIFRAENGEIRGRGVILSGPDAPPEAQEYINLLNAGAAGGVSIDGDSAQFDIVEGPEDNPFDISMVFSSINIRALTAVDIPAFAGAKIALSDAVIAAVIGSTSLPVASRDRNWDGLAAQRAIFDWAKTSDGYDTSKLSKAFLWRDSDGDPQAKGSYKLPFTEVIGGTLTIVPKAVFAAAAAVEGARGGVNIPASDKAGIRSKLTTLYGKIEPVEGEDGHPKPPWNNSKGDASDAVEEFNRDLGNDRDVQPILASGIPVNPPLAWFESPQFNELTPITIDDDGRVFGHLAGKETCHIGIGSCRTSPRNCDYDEYFHLGALKTAEGDTVYVGHMTFGGGHAPIENNAQTAAAFYDSTSRVSADIRAGEDEFGTWIAGALRPSLSDEDIREVRSGPLSGDWRPIKGKLQLIAAHAVNVPGFPIPRARVLVASGVTEALILTEDCDCDLSEEFAGLLFEMDLEELAESRTCKTEGGSCFPAGDFAYVPDSNKPSTWKLRLTESPGAKPTAAQVGRAIAALGKGFRGNKVSIPSGDLAKVKSKVRAAWRKANPDKSADDMPDVIKE